MVVTPGGLTSRVMSPDRALDQLFARTLGVITRAQALAAGLDDKAIARRVRSGAWVTVFPGVYRLSAVPPTWEQTLLAACLASGPGTVVSHRSAAIMWEINGFGGSVRELAVPDARFPRPRDVHVHRSSDLSGWTTVLRGVPITTPLRTLVDLGGVVRPWMVERAFADLQGRRLVTVASAKGALAALARRGRNGIAAFRECVERRLHTEEPSGWLESSLLPLVREADVPEPVAEYEVWHDGKLIGVADCAFPEAMLTIEGNGYEIHGSLEGWKRDHKRRRDFQAAGYEVLEFTSDEIKYERRSVRATIETTYWRRLALVQHLDPSGNLNVFTT